MKANVSKKPVLSISMIVKNEGKRLRRCLDSLKKVMDRIDCQLIITDTGSVDDTVEIAKEYADIVNHFEWCDDYSAARNFGLELARGEWYAFIDADEWYSDELADSIVKFFKSDACNTHHNCKFIIRNFHDEAHTDFADFAVSRYFRLLPSTRFLNRIHESIVPYDPTFTFKGICYHDGYAFSSTAEAFEKKYESYNIAIEKQLAEDDNNLSLLVSYMASVKDVAREEEIILKALSLLKPAYNIVFCNTVYYRAILYYFNCQRYDIALKYIDEYKDLMKKQKYEIYLDGYQIMALVYAFAKQYSDAVKYADIYLKEYDNYFKAPKKFNSITVNTISKNSKETFLLDIINKMCVYDVETALKYYKQYPLNDCKYAPQLFEVMLLHYAKNQDQALLYALLDTFESLNNNNYKEFLQAKLSGLFFEQIDNEVLYSQLDNYKNSIFVGAFCLLHHTKSTEKLSAISADLNAMCQNAAIAPYLAALMYSQQDITPTVLQLNREQITAAAQAIESLGDSLCSLCLKNISFAENAQEIKALMLYISLLDSALKRLNADDSESRQLITQTVISCMARFARGYYSQALIEGGAELLPSAHRFALQVDNASIAKDTSEYISVLRSAILTSPDMKPLAETLLEIIEQKLQQPASAPKTEFELLAESVKENAKALIAGKSTADALAVLTQLKALVPNDTEVDNLIKMCK